jgi:L-serine dehydratase
MFLSVFDLFKIGIGPSSSHTMGPMVAARRFLDEIAGDDWPRPAGARVARLSVSLHGSLAFTGVGHATDRAVMLGLAGETPLTVDPDEIDRKLAEIAERKVVAARGHPEYRFDPATDLVFDRKQPLPGHANGMAFSAFDAG